MADAQFLKSVELFEGLSEPELDLVASLMEPCVFDAGEVVFNEGEMGSVLYIILEGEVEILKKGAGSAEGFLLGRLGKRDWFGALAFFGRSARIDAARGASRTEALSL